MGAFLSAIPGIIGGVTSIFAGSGASKAARAAANTRTGAYQDARDLFRQGMDTGNAYLQDASGKAIDWAGKAADYAGGTAVDQANRSAADVSGRAVDAAGRVTDAATAANLGLDPYMKAGQGALGQISDLANKQFTFNQDDPSYQWRLQQGQQALERGAAARGGSMGGAAAKAMARYGQGAASTEYGAAFNRFLEGRQQQLGALGGLANLGYGATGQAGQNLINAGKYAGDTSIQAGEWGGNMRNQATQYAGNAGMRAAEYGGNMLANTATQLANNQRWGASNMADMTLGRSDSIASGILGQQAGKNQMLGGFGTMLGAGAQGYSDWYNQRGGGMMPGRGANIPDYGSYSPISMDTFGGGSPVYAPPAVNPYGGPTTWSGGPWTSGYGQG